MVINKFEVEDGICMYVYVRCK